jgi:hypothetical protein
LNSKPIVRTSLSHHLKSEPLLSRIDPLGIDQPVTNSVPFVNQLFTRVLCDLPLSLQQLLSLRSELSKSAIRTLQRQKGFEIASNSLEPSQLQVLNASIERKTIAIFPDEPIDAQSVATASAIELQLFGMPFRKLSNARLASWTPCMPIEIGSVEHMTKKIDALRTMSCGRCEIGAAIASASVYDDVRFLVDCGVDYICLLADAYYDFQPHSRHSLGQVELAIELAAKGLRDAGSGAKLHVSANVSDASSIFRCFQAGVDAVSVDAYLVSKRPLEVPVPKDRYSSVLSLATPVVAAYAWADAALVALIQELQDLKLFCG